MAQKTGPSGIPLSYKFGPGSSKAVVREGDHSTSTHDIDEGFPFPRRMEYAETRESVSTAPTSHHPSIVSEVSRFSSSSEASSPEDIPKSQYIEDVEEDSIGQLLCDHTDESIPPSERDSCRSDDDVANVFLANGGPYESNESAGPRRALYIPSSSRAPATQNKDPTFYDPRPKYQLFSRCRTNSEPLNSMCAHDTFSYCLRDYSPPPSYNATVTELDVSNLGAQAPGTDGYFGTYKLTSSKDRHPRTSWQAPLKHLRLPKFPSAKKRAPIVLRLPSNQPVQAQTLKALHDRRKILIPYHQSLATYHAQRIEQYAQEAEVRLLESQENGIFQTPSMHHPSIWARQDASDPMPRWSFWDEANRLISGSPPRCSTSYIEPTETPPHPTQYPFSSSAAANTYRYDKPHNQISTHIPRKQDFHPPKHCYHPQSYFHPSNNPTHPQPPPLIQFRSPNFATDLAPPQLPASYAPQDHATPHNHPLPDGAFYFHPTRIHPPKNLPTLTPIPPPDSPHSPTSGQIPIQLPASHDSIVSQVTTGWRTLRRKRGSENLLASSQAPRETPKQAKGKGIDKAVHVDYEEKFCASPPPAHKDSAAESSRLEDDSSDDRKFDSPTEYPKAAGYCWMDNKAHWARFVRKLENWGAVEEPSWSDGEEWDERTEGLYEAGEAGVPLEMVS